MARSALRLAYLAVLLAIALAPSARAQDGPPARDVVEVVVISGVLDPPASEYVLDRIAAAQDGSVHVLILQLDTPGGLDFPTRRVAEAMAASNVPVVVWIAPRGAQ